MRVKKTQLNDDQSAVISTPENTTFAPVQQEETVTLTTTQLNSLLERISNVEKNNNAPQKKSKKEKYSGPLTMRYGMYAKNENDEMVLTPILSMRPFSPKPNLDLVYKNEYGQYTENQMMELTLADNSKAKVTISEMKHLRPSQEKTPLFILDKDGNSIKGDSAAGRSVETLKSATQFVFHDETYGEIRVNSNCINIA